MWVSRKLHAFVIALYQDAVASAKEWRDKLVAASAKVERLEIENARLRSDLDWFKLRLNHVERERGQLIQAAIGVKVSVPEFIPKMDNPEEAFNAMPDLSTVGGDAKWEDPTGILAREDAADYSGLSGYRKHE